MSAEDQAALDAVQAAIYAAAPQEHAPPDVLDASADEDEVGDEK